MFTQKEQQIIEQMKNEGKTPQEIAGYIGGLRTNTTSSIAQRNGERPREVDESTFTRVLKDIPGDVVDYGKNSFNNFKNTGESIVDTAKNDNMNFAEKAVKIGSDSLKGIGRFIGESYLGAAKLFTTDRFEKSAAGALEEAGTAIAQTDWAQDAVSWYEEQSPEKQQQIQNILGYGEFLGEVGGLKTLTKGFKAGADGIKNASEAIATDVTEAVSKGRISQAARLANETLDEGAKNEAVDKLATVYYDSLVENRTSINRKLDELAASNSFGDKKVTRDDLLRNLAAEGIVPDVEGRLAKFTNVYEDLDARQSRVMEALKPILENSDATIKTQDLYEAINQSLIDNPQIVGGLSRSQAELDKLFESYTKKFGEELTATQVNEIRKESNALTKAFKDSDKFSADTASQIGRFTRQWLDENIPEQSVKDANAEWARLNTLRETAEIFDNQQIDVGIWGRALGSYMTAIGGVTAGGFAAGPAGAVTVGILTKMGGDKLADILRKRAFSPEVTAQLRDAISKDDALVARLKETASKQNQEILNKYLLPAEGDSSFRAANQTTPNAQNLIQNDLQSIASRLVYDAQAGKSGKTLNQLTNEAKTKYGMSKAEFEQFKALIEEASKGSE